MSAYKTNYTVDVRGTCDKPGLPVILHSEDEVVEVVKTLCRKCVDSERWRVDKPTITINVNHYSAGSVMKGRY